MRKPRKRYSAQEKIAILRRHLVEKEPVSQICDELGLNPNVFYTWQRQLFENGAAAFENHRRSAVDAKDARIEKLEEKLRQKNEVVAELLQEHVQLKKE